MAARDSLLHDLGYDSEVISSNVGDALRQVVNLTLRDQDRALAIIGHPAVEQWLAETESAGLLVHGNGRRHDPISAASVASALLVNSFANTLNFMTMCWFCGSHIYGRNGNASGMMRSLVCQVLSNSSFKYDLDLGSGIDGQDISKLLDLFKKLLRQLPDRTVVVCIIDGISYYESHLQRDDICKSIRKIVKLMRDEDLIVKLFITSATRTSYIHRIPEIADRLVIVEIPLHISENRHGFSHSAVVASTEEKVRVLAEELDKGGRAA